MGDYIFNSIPAIILGFCICMLVNGYSYKKDYDSTRIAILETKVAILLQERAEKNNGSN